MLRVDKTEPTIFSKIVNPKTTGYAAATGMVVLGARALTKNKTVLKSHKWIGVITAGLTALHIGLVEYYHNKYKKM
jgi:hypothetical protein